MLSKLKTVAVFAVATIFLLPGLASAGFGVSPPFIIEDRLVPGSSFERKIFLVQGAPERDLPASVSVESNEIKDWISFPNGSEFIIPNGVQQFPLVVRTEVPEDAELGIYRAFVRISTVPEKADEGGEIAIALGGLVEVELTVGDDIIVDYEIVRVEILDIKEGDSPQASIRIRNKGNAPIAPDGASFELFDKYGNTRLAFSSSKKDAFDRVPAFSEDEIIISFPIDVRIAIGEYWGHVKVYNDKGEVLGQVRTIFDVREKTFFEKYGLWLYGIGGLIFLALLVFTIYALILRWKNKRARRLQSSL
jgi:hypothetical protein